MSIKELGLRLAAAATLAIPPAAAIGVQVGPRCALNGDAIALDLQEGATPFFIAPCCLAFENNLSSELAN